MAAWEPRLAVFSPSKNRRALWSNFNFLRFEGEASEAGSGEDMDEDEYETIDKVEVEKSMN